MSTVAENAQSAQYVDFWNEILVPKFIKYKHILVDGLTHHSEAILPSLPVKEGDRVFDIGCGFGDTAIKLAKRVGPKGKVVGLDCCEAFLEYGRKDAAELGLQNISFVYGDALLDHFEPEYDFVFSRFGTMFFANPVVGLRNMRKRSHEAHVLVSRGGLGFGTTALKRDFSTARAWTGWVVSLVAMRFLGSRGGLGFGRPR